MFDFVSDRMDEFYLTFLIKFIEFYYIYIYIREIIRFNVHQRIILQLTKLVIGGNYRNEYDSQRGNISLFKLEKGNERRSV